MVGVIETWIEGGSGRLSLGAIALAALLAFAAPALYQEWLVRRTRRLLSLNSKLDQATAAPAGSGGPSITRPRVSIRARLDEGALDHG